MTKRQTSPPDLEMRVRTIPENGKTRLSYTLHSPTGVALFFQREIVGPTIQEREYHARLLPKFANLDERLDVDGARLLRNEIERKLVTIGRQLWRELFSPEFWHAYRDIRRSVKTWLLVSDEPWIPWELIKPYDASRPNEIIDDDFLAVRFELTRWLAGDKTPAPQITVHHLATIRTAKDLPQSAEELSFLAEFASVAGVDSGLEMPTSTDDLLAFLETSDAEALHFVGHGQFIAEQPDESTLSAGRQFLSPWRP